MARAAGPGVPAFAQANHKISTALGRKTGSEIREVVGNLLGEIGFHLGARCGRPQIEIGQGAVVVATKNPLISTLKQRARGVLFVLGLVGRLQTREICRRKFS
jgi:hypothetical protein